MKWEAVFFDFDGVICDSVNIKTDAFAEMYRPYGVDIEKKVIDYHLANGGVSRFEKFKYWHKEFLNKEINEKEIDILANQFSELVLKKVIEAPYVGGALDALNTLKENNIPAYIVSGTPHDEINHIVKEKGLQIYFKEVHGSPRKKGEIVKDIILRYRHNTDNCLFLGDAMSDYQAALANHVHFFGIVPKGEKSIFPDKTCYFSKVCLEAE